MHETSILCATEIGWCCFVFFFVSCEFNNSYLTVKEISNCFENIMHHLSESKFSRLKRTCQFMCLNKIKSLSLNFKDYIIFLLEIHTCFPSNKSCRDIRLLDCQQHGVDSHTKCERGLLASYISRWCQLLAQALKVSLRASQHAIWRKHQICRPKGYKSIRILFY